ncbi:MAG: carbohydrate porin, partial [Acidobacteriaceae bacterium]|nr:carbohydrate porin [Acidobacteriaceae bacterium]
MTFLPALLFGMALSWLPQSEAPQAQQPPENPPAHGGQIPRQEENKTAEKVERPERWNLFWQATSVGQYHGTFRSPYAGANSLRDRTERSWSMTSTIFLGLRLDQNTRIYVNPELSGGLGFSSVTGLANYSNGELTRVASVSPKPYLARAYIEHDFGWGAEKESFESEENQLAGERPVNRYTSVIGRFTVTDFFDNNRYSHDPRTQFMGWAIMYNGAWDYPADVRGYTWGWYNELHTRNWSLRYAAALEPKVANGERLDRRVLRDRGDLFEVERRHAVDKHPGAVRALGFLLHTNSGSYQESLKLASETGTQPDITATRQIGRLKYGAALNAEQEITSDLGVFARLGWNDGKTESFAFTAMDRLAQGGVSLTGTRWKRHFDTVATGFTAGGLSSVHTQYLEAGGLDFLIGDGRLTYAPEYVWESYYSARILPGFFAAFDLQRI